MSCPCRSDRAVRPAVLTLGRRKFVGTPALCNGEGRFTRSGWNGFFSSPRVEQDSHQAISACQPALRLVRDSPTAREK